MAAGDTFRAAAEEQLNIWSQRAGADIVRNDGADPASVVYDAIQKQKMKTTTLFWLIQPADCKTNSTLCKSCLK